MELIDKDALIAEIDRRITNNILLQQKPEMSDLQRELQNRIDCLNSIKGYILNALEVIDPYELQIQYASVRGAIQAHAETYSFNIESELFNQLTEEQQKLWRKEIEQACISGADAGYSLAKDIRYKENLEEKEVNLDKELVDYHNDNFSPCNDGTLLSSETGGELTWYDYECIAKHFFELGLSVNNPITAADRGTAEEIITNLQQVEEDYRIDLTKEKNWVLNKVQKG